MNSKIHRKSSLKIFEHENIVLCTYQQKFVLQLETVCLSLETFENTRLKYISRLPFLFFVPDYFNECAYEKMKYLKD